MQPPKGAPNSGLHLLGAMTVPEPNHHDFLGFHPISVERTFTISAHGTRRLWFAANTARAI
jgi:hypothetical protein